MWRQIMPYVVLALAGMVSLSLLVMLLSILRTFLLKTSPDRLLRRRRSVYMWAFNSLVLIAALVASGLVMVPKTSRLELLPSRPAAPAPAPAAITPAKLWSRLGGNFIPLPSQRGPAPIKPATVTPPARPPVTPIPPAVKKPTGSGAGWTELLAGLALKMAGPAPFEPPKVILPSTAPETPPIQVPPPPAAPAAPSAPTAPATAPAPTPGPRPSAPTVGVGPTATPPAVPAPPPRVQPVPRPPAPPPPPAAPAAAPAPAPARKRCWALSTDSFRRRDRAIYARRRRGKLGLVLHPLARVRVRGKWWYRVIVGCFPTRQAAQRYARRLRKKGLTRDVAQVMLRPKPRARAGP